MSVQRLTKYKFVCNAVTLQSGAVLHIHDAKP